MKCECADTGRMPEGMLYAYDSVTERPFANHAPGECKCTNELQRYRRANGEIKGLCSCCHRFSDTLVEKGS